MEGREGRMGRMVEGREVGQEAEARMGTHLNLAVGLKAVWDAALAVAVAGVPVAVASAALSGSSTDRRFGRTIR